MSSKKTAPKKIRPKKVIQKKDSVKKAAPKKVTAKKSGTKKTKPEKKIPKLIISESAIEQTPTTEDCLCKQKRRNGQYFYFTLVQGRWVQSSAIPFPTKELCEEANC